MDGAGDRLLVFSVDGEAHGVEIQIAGFRPVWFAGY